MGFPDFEIAQNERSYVRSDEILDFLNQYADHFQLKKHIRFNSYVIRVAPKKNKWQVNIYRYLKKLSLKSDPLKQVLVKDVTTNKIEFHYFDKVMVANGHYHTPNYIKIPNMHRFKGNFMHSHDFRKRDVFQGLLKKFIE